jgi:hypothetical protein
LRTTAAFLIRKFPEIGRFLHKMSQFSRPSEARPRKNGIFKAKTSKICIKTQLQQKNLSSERKFAAVGTHFWPRAAVG